jgi:2-methylcitrate dehydratase PrpD
MHGRNHDEPRFYDPTVMTARLGERWHILTYNTKGSGVPCVTGLQTPSVTAVALQNKYHVNHRDIASVVVEHCVEDGLVQAESIHGTHLGRTPEQRLGSAGWSRRWMVALCLVLGRAGIREQLNKVKPYGRYRDIEALSEKVEARVNHDYYAEHFKGRPYPNTYGGRILVTLNDGTIYDHEPLRYLGCRLSDGSINTASYQQLIAKMNEQAPLAGISGGKQEKIVEFITYFEEQPNVLPLLANMIR